MVAVSDWDVVPDNNNSVNGISIVEGCEPNVLNNMGRAIMAAVKSFWLVAYRKDENVFIQPTGDPLPTMAEGDILMEYIP